MDVKMVIVLRSDLNMPKGKLVAQGGHGILGCYRKILKLSIDNSLFKELLDAWEYDDIVKKISLKVKSEIDLLNIYKASLELADKGIVSHLVIDNGLTMFDGVKTKTGVVLLGPSVLIDSITGNLNLL